MNVKKIFAERPMIKGNYIDTGLLVAIILLWGLGLMILYVCSAEYGVKAFSDSQYFIRRQLIMSGMGLVVMIVAFLVPQSFIRRCLPFIVGGTFVLCVLPFLPGIGSPRNGAHRWISLPFFGDTFQPSELVKIAVVLFIANWFDKFIKTPEDKTRSIFPPVFMLCVFSGIVMFQDDFSTSLLIFVLGFLVMFVAGARLGGLVPFIVLAGLTMLLFVFTSTFRVNRLIAFLNPNFDTHGSNYQTVNARTAISDGGFLGNGFGEGLDKINFVPEIPTDYIFSGWAESMGFLGVLGYFLLLAFFAWRGYTLMMESKDKFSALLAFGLTSSILMQSLMNCGVVCGVLPVTGITLPFISYGGSSLLVTCCMCGLLLNVSYHNSIEEIDEV